MEPGELEISIKDPDLIVYLGADYTIPNDDEEYVYVQLVGRAIDFVTALPIVIRFFTTADDVGPPENDRILYLPETLAEQKARLPSQVRLSQQALTALLAIVASNHRRTFNFSAVPDPQGRGLLIESFEFYLEPSPKPLSLN
ncbi:hypothetical protein [Novosphingobium soli]|uniref:Uncharacterized protein n=1 Tax=Novosphingobium soli TaxID=574956 RepID=A0ABV6CY69_9SPHN